MNHKGFADAKRVKTKRPGKLRHFYDMHRRPVQLLGVVAVFILAGTLFIVLPKAATPTVSLNANNGQLAGNATTGVDGSTSYVQFNAPTPTNPGTPTTCTTFSTPITITTGGTYTGCWQTTSGNAPAVVIATTQPVIIQNSTMKGPGRLVSENTTGINLTIRNSNFIGVTPSGTVDNRRAVWVRKPSNLRLENNYLENNGGFKVVEGWSGTNGPNNTITILRNSAKNITSDKTTGSDWANQFFQMDGVHISNMEIAWNQVINEFQKSKVEDNINFFNSGGTAGSPISVHDNFIWGAYPLTLDGGYSGGGIIMVDAYDDALHGYFNVFNNQVVGSANYGISIVGGSYTKVYNNRLINSNKIPSGQQFTNPSNGSLGLSFWRHGSGSGPYENNSMTNNYIAWWSSNGGCCHRNDWWTPNATGTNTFSGNTQYQPTNANIPYSMEEAEYATWQQKLQTNGVKVGPQ